MPQEVEICSLSPLSKPHSGIWAHHVLGMRCERRGVDDRRGAQACRTPRHPGTSRPLIYYNPHPYQLVLVHFGSAAAPVGRTNVDLRLKLAVPIIPVPVVGAPLLCPAHIPHLHATGVTGGFVHAAGSMCTVGMPAAPAAPQAPAPAPASQHLPFLQAWSQSVQPRITQMLAVLGGQEVAKSLVLAQVSPPAPAACCFGSAPVLQA